MTQTTAIQANDEAARNWCASLLQGMKPQFAFETSRRDIDLVVDMLTGDIPPPLTDDEKRILCRSWDTELYDQVCIVRGVKYIDCGDCPYFTGDDIV